MSDPLAPLCDSVIGDLAVGESTSYDCDLGGVAGDFTNTAAVSAEDPIGGVLTDSDTAEVDMISPSIEITKDPASQDVVPGGTASFSISVTNTGDADLTNVAVSDPLAPLCGNAIGNLAVGESLTYSCDLANVAAGFTNTADVSGEDPTGGTVSDSDSAEVRLLAPSVGIVKNPLAQTVVTGGTATFEITVVNSGDAPLTNATVSDPQAPACDSAVGDLAVGASVTYSCDLAGVTADFTNTASVTADDPIGNPVSASDFSDVDVINPAISLQKDPSAQSVVTGRTAAFAITVTNVGDVDLTSVDVTDPLAPLCDNAIGDLAVGVSVTYNCDLTGVTSDFTNTATVTAADPTGGSVEDSDTADVTVLTPSIAIAKSPASQQILIGDDAAFAITVTNDGEADLTDVNVSDPLAPACDNSIGDLAVGASVTYNCDLVAVTADFTNVVNVVGSDPAGGSVPATDTADVDVIDPEIRIEKNPGSQDVLPGGTASFSITVTNVGDVDLTNVNVSDPLVPSCDNAIGGLAVGASVTYSCDLTGISADLTNTADVVGTDPLASTVSDSDTADVNVLLPSIGIDKSTSTPQVVVGGTATFTITVTNTGTAPLTGVVVSDPQAPDCDRAIGDLGPGSTSSYSCTLAGLLGDTTNTATATGADGGGGTVSDTDSEAVDVISPQILIAKTPNSQSVIVNGTVDFTITVTNVGDVPLTDVEVVDAFAPSCGRTIGDLAASASVSFDCDLPGVTADFTNSATVTGNHPISGPVRSTDTADVTILSPDIDITKTAVDSVVRYGSDAVFDILVTNSGQTDLANVVVSDPLTPDCDNTIGSLALGASVWYSCTLVAVTTDVVNSATVNGEDAVANFVTDTDTAAITVITPAVEIAKTPDLQQVLAGATVTFDITVTNQGDVPLTGVVVSDPLAPDCDRILPDLAAFESTSYSCSLAGVATDFTNTATVDASDPLGGSVTDDDDAVVDVVNPGIDIQKTPDTQTILTGDVATFTITVTNEGDQDIADATIADPAAPNCDLASTGPLAVGESTAFTCATDALAADLVNIASVDGVDVLGNPVSDSDDAAVEVIDPSLTIDKTPDAQAIVVGGVANFTITVANTGDADLSAVEVVDPLAPACDVVIGDLAAGASTTHSCTLSGVPADFTNTVDVSAVDELDNPWTATDTADVTVLTPAVDIVKGPAYQVVNTGGDATFTITVTNSGQTPLSGVTVTDGQAPLCDRSLGDLAVGESLTYPCAQTGLTTDFVNTASASGRDPIGGPVLDEDTAIVDVISPAITISKTPDSQTVLAGDDVRFDITVTNTGDVTLTDVAVSDPLSPPCATVIGDLVPGGSVSYSCTLTGVTASFANVADVSGTDVGGNPVTDRDTADVTVIQIGSVTGLVFLDADADAIYNNADVLLAGVPVDLFDAAGSLVASTVTAADGRYRFDDVPVGDYTVDVFGDDPAIPANGLLTTANDPQAVVVSAGAETRATDTGYAPPAMLAGKAFVDADTNGVDGGEPGVGALTVNIWVDSSGDGTPDTIVATTTTAADGRWMVGGLLGGTYAVEYVTPAGRVATVRDVGVDDTIDSDIDPVTGMTPSVALPTGGMVGDLDAGYFDPGTIGDHVFADANGNGALDAAEIGLPGIGVVATWAGPDGSLGTADDQTYTATTVAGGDYLLTGLPGGLYSVEVIEPVGAVVSTGNDPFQLTLPAAGSNLDADFGLDGNGVLSGSVYDDANNNGVRDTAETGIEAVEIRLTGTDLDGLTVDLTALTDSDGGYAFANLTGGTYTLTQSQPGGFLDGKETVGTVGGDATVNDVISAVVLPRDVGGFGYDFGEIRPASLTGSVLTAAGDPIPGVTVSLGGTDDLGGSVNVNAVTAADGSFVFDGLRPGEYSLVEAQPANYGEGGETAGTAGGDATTNLISAIFLPPGVDASAYVFTETTGSLEGSVYFDVDGSGVFDGLDVGIGGVLLTLTGTDADGTAVNRSTLSDSTGAYAFDELLPGTYTITENQPLAYADGADAIGSLGGVISINDVISAIVLAPGAAGTGYDFGEVGAEATGRVYLDYDANGVEDGADAPLSGVVVELLDATGTQLAVASTAADGSFRFTDLLAGDYTVREVQPVQWSSSTPDEIAFTLTNNGRSGLDFGDKPGSISGVAFADSEGDGLSSGDTGVDGIEVTLIDGAGTTVAQTTTALDGSYSFTGLAAGDYAVVVVAPDGFTFSPVDVGGDDSIDSDVDPFSSTVIITLGAGEDLTRLDAGITPIVLDLGITVTVPKDTYKINEQVPFTLVAVNNSNTIASGGVAVRIPLPAGSESLAAAGDGWTITPGVDGLEAVFAGDLLPGQAAPPIVVTLRRSTPGSIDLPGEVTFVDPTMVDAVSANNLDRAVVKIEKPRAIPIPVPTLPMTGVTTLLLLAFGGFFLLSGRGMRLVAGVGTRKDDDPDVAPRPDPDGTGS